MNEYVSNLAPLIVDFLEFKNALGIQYHTGSYYLKQLDIYNCKHKNVSIPDCDTVERWALAHAEKSTTGDRSWISPIREFGRYLQSIGISNAYVLDKRFTIQRDHAEVYLLTGNEIQCFFKECDKYVLHYKALGRPYVLPALYRFMYCCGVRCSEARKLKCSDVHLDKGYVDILQSKARRDRRLFLSNELIEYLTKYNKAISKCLPNREYFFPGGYGGMCSSTAISANFRNIWVAAGLKRDGKVKPRAYDFRHHFACANIMRWSTEGKDIHAMLPYLMRYMGHTGIESAYYYIHLIPDFFPKYNFSCLDFSLNVNKRIDLCRDRFKVTAASGNHHAAAFNPFPDGLLGVVDFKGITSGSALLPRAGKFNVLTALDCITRCFHERKKCFKIGGLLLQRDVDILA